MRKRIDLIAEDFEFYPAVELATFLFVIVGGQRLVFTISRCRNTAWVNSLGCKKTPHGIGAVLWQVLLAIVYGIAGIYMLMNPLFADLPPFPVWLDAPTHLMVPVAKNGVIPPKQ